MMGLTPYDYARKKVVYCWLDEPVNEAARRLAAENIGSMVVDDRNGRHVGMLTDFVLFNALSGSGDVSCMQVKDLHLEPLLTAPMDAEINLIMGLFDKTESGRIALVDEDGEIAGILKKKNLLRFSGLIPCDRQK
jgi:predicted transcriptional regulator